MIIIYTVPNCEHCNEAKEYFKSKNIQHTVIDMSVGGDKGIQTKKKQFKALGINEYPVIIITQDECNGEMIVPGFNETEMKHILRKML